jgi:hypothetical protein
LDRGHHFFFIIYLSLHHLGLVGFLDVYLFRKNQQVVLNQARPVDVKRLRNQIGEISKDKLFLIVSKYIEIVKS